MAFDWREFLTSHGIEFIDSGKNVKSGWLNIACPLCGSADPSQHLGLSPTGWWGCLRDGSHRGGSAPKLIQALLGCDWRKATELAGDWREPRPVSGEDLAAQVASLEEPASKPPLGEIRYPASAFKQIKQKRGLTHDYFDYLAGRGFRVRDIPDLCHDYQLRAAVGGKWRGRLILPFLGRHNQVYGWQGRAISRSDYRYLSYPDGNAAKRLLYNFGPAWRSKRREVLVICEGPLDVLRVDFYGRDSGIRAVGTLGTSFLPAQVNEIYRLAPRYDRVLVLFDPEAEASAWDLATRLSPFNAVMGSVPEGVEDPGALKPSQVLPAIRACFSE